MGGTISKTFGCESVDGILNGFNIQNIVQLREEGTPGIDTPKLLFWTTWSLRQSESYV